jgi:hypothetical protein
MKTNFTHIVIIRIILFILICLYSILVFGQDVNPKTASALLVNHTKTTLATELSGTVANEKVNLQWSFVTGNDVNTVVVEKGYTSTEFKDCAMFWVNVDGNNMTNFKYADKYSDKRAVYYRLKIIENSGNAYYSNIFHVPGKSKK